MRRAFLSSLALLLALGAAAPSQAQPDASGWRTRAERAERAGQHARALRLLRRGLTRSPTDAHLALALCEAILPRDAEAAAQLESEALRARVSEAETALAAAAPTDDGLAVNEVARAALQRSLWLEHAWHRALAGDLAGAVQSIAERRPRVDRQAALRAREISSLAIRRGDLRAASAALALSRSADATLDGLAREQAALWAARGRLRDSADVLRHWLEGHPQDAAASVALARALLADGEADDAMELYEAWAAQCPRPVPCQLEWIRGLLQAHRYPRARLLALALGREPTPDALSFTLLGLAELGLRHPAAATAAFRHALELDPGDVQARASLRALDGADAHEASPPSSGAARRDTPAMLAP